MSFVCILPYIIPDGGPDILLTVLGRPVLVVLSSFVVHRLAVPKDISPLTHGHLDHKSMGMYSMSYIGKGQITEKEKKIL